MEHYFSNMVSFIWRELWKKLTKLFRATFDREWKIWALRSLLNAMIFSIPGMMGDDNRCWAWFIFIIASNEV